MYEPYHAEAVGTLLDLMATGTPQIRLDAARELLYLHQAEENIRLAAGVPTVSGLVAKPSIVDDPALD